MNELKPEDVMRALECCLKLDCKSCPYYVRFKEYTFDVKCGDVLIADALALLREKDAEIERLQAEISRFAEALFEKMQTARAEAITEFAKELTSELIMGGIYPVFVKGAIERTDKKLKGATDGKTDL